MAVSCMPHVTLSRVASWFEGTPYMGNDAGRLLGLPLCLPTRMGNWWPSRCCCSQTPSSLSQHGQSSGMVGAVVQLHLEGHRFLILTIHALSRMECVCTFVAVAGQLLHPIPLPSCCYVVAFEFSLSFSIRVYLCCSWMTGCDGDSKV